MVGRKPLRNHGRGAGNGSAPADRGHEDAAVLPHQSGRRQRAVPQRLGAHAGRERRPDRSHPRSPLHRRRRAANAVQHHLSARAHLSDVGPVPTQRRGEHRFVHSACVGTEVVNSSWLRITSPLSTSATPSWFLHSLGTRPFASRISSVPRLLQGPLRRTELTYRRQTGLKGDFFKPSCQFTVNGPGHLRGSGTNRNRWPPAGYLSAGTGTHVRPCTPRLTCLASTIGV